MFSTQQLLITFHVLTLLVFSFANVYTCARVWGLGVLYVYTYTYWEAYYQVSCFKERFDYHIYHRRSVTFREVQRLVTFKKRVLRK